MNEINFLNALQNVLSKVDGDKKGLITSATNLIRNSFLTECIYFYLFDNNRWENVELYNYNCKQLPDPVALINVLAKESTGKIIQNVSEDPVLRDIAGQFTSLISLPLSNDERVIGHLLCATVKKDTVLTYNDFQVLNIAAKQLAAAIEKIDRDQALRRMNEEILEREQQIMLKNQLLNEANQKLLVAANTDSLTGLANRQAILTILDQEKNRLQFLPDSEHAYFSLLFIDLDNFKYLNDNFGHYIGDLVLRRFADLLRSTVKNLGVTARFGGDEFIVFLPNHNLDHVKPLAVKILHGLAEAEQFLPEIENVLGYPATVPEHRRLSCSIGISQYTHGTGLQIEDILRQSDLALNHAKRTGKNRIATWEEDLCQDQTGDY
ncbi:MAG TPA: sensor domain-containing diguanylate cyclase [Firmicutes bacterium]|jgi:diguanylate cyclase (GGDEF)-like protein|nr:sensor domain-containing diguanylate cyclase [Bacillota bacterium]HOQ24960.1 sensor domain-containing diguanylate cyclase [Bacillota bacterium]HPT68209.1 sensor domain-containing diguanylate cyclase [Bacillota bacterium]